MWGTMLYRGIHQLPLRLSIVQHRHTDEPGSSGVAALETEVYLHLLWFKVPQPIQPAQTPEKAFQHLQTPLLDMWVQILKERLPETAYEEEA